MNRLLIGVALVASSGAVWAASNNCGTPAGTPTNSTYANPTTAESMSSAAGCQVIDDTFNNFNVSSTGITIPQTTNNTNILGTATAGPFLDPTQVDVNISPNNTWNQIGAGTNTVTIEFTVNSSDLTFDGASLDLNGLLAAHLGTTVSENVYICSGTTFCTSGGNLLTTITLVENHTSATSVVGVESGFASNSTLAVEAVVTLNVAGIARAELSSFDILFDETTPEPGTLYTAAPVLMGLAFFSYRRKKKARA